MTLHNLRLGRANFEKVVILIILLSLIPVLLEVVKARRKTQ